MQATYAFYPHPERRAAPLDERKAPTTSKERGSKLINPLVPFVTTNDNINFPHMQVYATPNLGTMEDSSTPISRSNASAILQAGQQQCPVSPLDIQPQQETNHFDPTNNQS